MTSFIDDIKRNMLPLWRSYKDVALARELEYSGKGTLMPFNRYDSFKDLWKTKKTIVSAADLINAAVACGEYQQDVFDAAEYMIMHSGECPDLALDVARSIVQYPPKSVSNLQPKEPSFETVADELIKKLQIQENETKVQIGLLRKQAQIHCYNPIVYCELARCYANLGMDEKAKNYMNYAVYLAPHSRYISRCAARFYVHYGEYDRAKRVLIANGYINTDPWLMSAEISVESVMGKSSRYIKVGRQLVLSNNLSPFSSSELCFAICNEDREAGKRKDARKMYEKGIIDPNDNSLAQAEFYAKNDVNINLDFSSFSRIVHKHEADTRNALSQEKYKEAFISSLKWMQDYRFEHRPIEFAFALSCDFLKKYDYAVEIVKRFLKTNPNDPTSINNLAYVLGLSDRIDEAEQVLSQINFKKYDKENNTNGICLLATCGLLAYRRKNVEEGRKLYNMAISAANKRKDKNLAAKARLNMIREEIHNIEDYNESILNEMESLSTENKVETEQLKKDIRDEIKKKREKQSE